MSTGLTHLPDAREPLSEDAARDAFEAIMAGRVNDEAIARFLVEMADRGETVEEIVAAARTLQGRALTVCAPEGAIDVCGTGGDGKHSLNVSTAVAIVVAACGVPVAKHGNRAASSRSGAADVLVELGIDIDAPVATVERTLNEIGIGFLFSANHHSAMAHVAAVRRALGRRTIFNLVGPLANPAGVSRQLVGVFDPKWLQPMARALAALGVVPSMVVHGDDGMDELTVTAGSRYAMLDADGAAAQLRTIQPADAGLGLYPAEGLQGGAPAENAARLRQLLNGQQDAYRDIVLLNAAAALIVADRATGWLDGAQKAAAAIDSGAAHDLLERWKAFR